MKSHPLRSLLLAGLVSITWLSQFSSSSAITFPTEWKLIPAQDADGKWLGALQVQTVPGVVYHLQRSTTLMGGSWTTIRSLYGMGEEWVCPVLPGSAPPVGTLPQEVIDLPAYPAQPLKQVTITLGKTAAGEVSISFISPDDGTMKQKVFSGVMLDAAWEEFDSSYFNPHGNFWMSISPQLQSPTEGPVSPSTFGPQDEAMLAVFAASLGEMTVNIINSIELAKNYSPPLENSESKAFYRITADWGVDTNGGGRFDWQQLILDGTDPFSPPAPDGDKAGDGTTGSESGYPVPGAVAGPTPLAHFEQQTMTVESSFMEYPDRDKESPPQGDAFADIELSEDEYQDLRYADTYGSFKDVVDELSFSTIPWAKTTMGNFSVARTKFFPPPTPPHPIPGAHGISFTYSRARFRLKLDAAAPTGGYSIPMRIGILRQKVIDRSGTIEFAPAVAGEQLYIDVTFNCPENQSVTLPVEFNSPLAVGENERITFVPASVSTREDDIIDGDVIGAAGPVPENGTCVVENSFFAADFGNQSAKNLPGYQGTPLKLHWRSRQLHGSGILSGWTKLTKIINPSIPHEGTHTYIDAGNTGIHQLQALLVLPNGSEIEFPFFRMRDAKSIQDSSPIPQVNMDLKAGSLDYFGVARNSISLAVRDSATQWLGSTAYAFTANVPVIPGDLLNPNLKNKDKCNLFVTHISISCGATTPYFRVRGIRPSAPIARDDWYGEPEKHIDLDGPGWSFIISGEIAPGNIVAGYGTGHSSGHVGIIDYDGSWISAGPKTVNKFIHFENMDAHYRPYTIRSR